MFDYLEEAKFEIIKFLVENEDSADWDYLSVCADEINCYIESDGLYETYEGIEATAKEAMKIINKSRSWKASFFLLSPL